MSDERVLELISRVAGGEASTRDWDDLAARAAADPSLWRTVAEAQRDDADLVRHVNEAVAIADRVDLDFGAPPQGIAGRIYPYLHWTGWGLAAALAVVLVSRWNAPLGGQWAPPAAAPQGMLAQGQPDRSANAIEVTPVSSDEALRHYLSRGSQEGRVLGQMPGKMLLEIHPSPAGGHELIYLRPIIERVRVPQVYQIDGEDESGQPTLRPYEAPGRGAM